MSATEAPPEEQGLFDRRKYDLIPKQDGHTATGLRLTFSGGVPVDLMDEEQLQHFRALLLGDEIKITVHATVSGVGWSHKEDQEGEKDPETINKITLRVHSYDVEEVES